MNNHDIFKEGWKQGQKALLEQLKNSDDITNIGYEYYKKQIEED